MVTRFVILSGAKDLRNTDNYYRDSLAELGQAEPSTDAPAVLRHSASRRREGRPYHYVNNIEISIP